MASTGEAWRLGRRPALDGLRGIAILLVVVCHAEVPGMIAGGPVGVSIFFTLSGFLITSLLLDEHAREGRIDLIRFFHRRARRLVPALAVSTVAVAAASVWIGPWFFTWPDALSVAFYGSNWLMTSTGTLGGLGGTWSLAVEEQFYVIWPVMLTLCLRRGLRFATVAAAGLAVAAMVWRIRLGLAGASVMRIAYGSDMHADALLLGCLLAIALHSSRERAPLTVLGAGAVGAVILCAGMPERAMYELAPLAVPVFTAIGVYCVTCCSARSSCWLGTSSLQWVGKRSYGLYLWHVPVSIYLNSAHPTWPWQLRLVILLATAGPLTVLSWKYIELPFLPKRRSQTVPIASGQGEPLHQIGLPMALPRVTPRTPAL